MAPEPDPHDEREGQARRGDSAASAGGPAALGKGAAYQGAVEAVFAVLVGVGLGYWADQRLETSPWLLFAGAGVGFAAFVLRLLRLRPPTSGSPEAGAPAPDEEDAER